MTLNIPDTENKRVIVIGGGFAGLKLVRKLSRSPYQVVLVDRNNFHMFQPLLYQVATAAINPGDIAFPFRKLFRGKKNVFYRMAEVRKVDAVKNRIYTDRGSLDYDYLVLATGSTTNFFGMENIEKTAFPMKEVVEAQAIRNRVLLHVEKAVELGTSLEREALLNIVIVGGGATGVELAGAFAEMKNHIIPKDYPEYHHSDVSIYLVEGGPKLIGTMSEKTSAKALEILETRGVNVWVDSTVTDYVDQSVVLKDGRRIPTRNLIWTSGVTVKVPAGLEKFPRGKGSRLLTDMYFRLKGSDNIFAVGDASLQQDDPANPTGYPQLARVAIEQAGHLANNLKRLADGKLPDPFDYRQYPVLATVGRNKAFVEYKDFRMDGFAAWVAWAGIHLFLLLGVKNKLNVFWEWFWNYVTWDMPTRIIMVPHQLTAPQPRSKQRSRSRRPGGRPQDARSEQIAEDNDAEKPRASKKTNRNSTGPRKPSGVRKPAPKKEKVTV
ncbi:MAG: NAD(P)/FAD-dependent oxidoreductase [Rikenellaceae bacterium]|nr:NAD(P)/FAD-dependent oxidoreductase [Rikenellaceae bacterium]